MAAGGGGRAWARPAAYRGCSSHPRARGRPPNLLQKNYYKPCWEVYNPAGRPLHMSWPLAGAGQAQCRRCPRPWPRIRGLPVVKGHLSARCGHEAALAAAAAPAAAGSMPPATRRGRAAPELRIGRPPADLLGPRGASLSAAVLPRARPCAVLGPPAHDAAPGAARAAPTPLLARQSMKGGRGKQRQGQSYQRAGLTASCRYLSSALICGAASPGVSVANLRISVSGPGSAACWPLRPPRWLGGWLQHR